MRFIKLVIWLLVISIMAIGLSSCNPRFHEMWIVGDFTSKEDDFSISMKIGCDYYNDQHSKDSNDLKCVMKGFHLKDGDSEENRKDSSNQVKKILMEAANKPEVLAIVGLQSSELTIYLQQLAGPLNVPVFAPIATNSDISNRAIRDGFHNFYRLVATDEIQAKKISDFIIKKLLIAPRKSRQDKKTKTMSKNILILTDDSAYGRDLGEGIFKKLQEESIGAERIPLTTKKNVEPLKKQLDGISPKLGKADFLVFAGYTDQSIQTLQFASKSQYKNPILLTDGSYEYKFLQEINKVVGTIESDKLYISSISPDWKENDNAKKIINYYKNNSENKVKDDK